MSTLLLANLLHGLVALVWVAGLRRFAGPLPATLWADLLRLSVVLSPIILLLRVALLPAPPDALSLVRIALWSESLAGAGLPTLLIGGSLLLGTAVLFMIQEAWPAWRWRRGRFAQPHVRDPRLEASLLRVQSAWTTRGPSRWSGRAPQVRRLETFAVVAGLQGVVTPVVVVSRGLLDKLDDHELDGAVAHELAHLARGGNLRLLVVWAMRALQAASPAALVLFRALIEAEEAACDEIAATVTRRPGALGSALLVAHGDAPLVAAGASRIQRARAEVLRRADLASTRARVVLLLEDPPRGNTTLVWLVACVTLGGMLWAIG